MPYSFTCDWQAGFVMNPLSQHRVGYLTDFNGLGLSAPLAKDLNVYCPHNNAVAPTYAPLGAIVNGNVNVIAALANYSWKGGVGDPHIFSCYMSSQNANLLRTVRQVTPMTTSIPTFGWWVTNFDLGAHVWFEEVYPKAPARPSGQLNTPGPGDIRLTIANAPVQVSPNINVSVYNVYIEILPPAGHTATISLATSSTKVVVLPWGSVVSPNQT